MKTMLALASLAAATTIVAIVLLPRQQIESQAQEVQFDGIYHVGPNPTPASMYRKLDEWGVEQVAVVYEADCVGEDCAQQCVVWIRWKDGRETCIPSDQPEAFYESRYGGCGLYVWEKTLVAALEGPCPPSKEPQKSVGGTVVSGPSELVKARAEEAPLGTLTFPWPGEDEILTFPGVDQDGKAFPLTYKGPRGSIWVDEKGEVRVEGEITMDEACRKFWQTLAQTHNEICGCR